MSMMQEFKLSGVAIPHDAKGMLDEMCEHFIEHSVVERDGNLALLKGDTGVAALRLQDNRLLIELNCPSEQAMQMTCNSIAEHLAYFAGEDLFEISWSTPQQPRILPDLHEVTVVSAEDVTPCMRRVKMTCDDLSPFAVDGMHVRLLIPPKDRKPVWPKLLPDGRTGWPEGEDELVARIYTIRAVDLARRELWIDFFQHPSDVATPGADFARDARPGQRLALVGPVGGGFPPVAQVLVAGDETALPAIARMLAEAAPHSRIQAIIEVNNAAEEQVLSSPAELKVRWLHRESYQRGDGPADTLGSVVKASIAAMEEQTFVWVACEKEELRSIKALLKQRGHDRKMMYAAWYWDRKQA